MAVQVGQYVPIYTNAAAGVAELSRAVAGLVAASAARFAARRGQLEELLFQANCELELIPAYAEAKLWEDPPPATGLEELH